MYMSVCLSAPCVRVSPTSTFPTTTSSVEELPGIFSGECKVPRNTAQQLNDVGYVVYRGERGRRRREERTEGRGGGRGRGRVEEEEEGRGK